MSQSAGQCLRVLRIAAIACLPLLGGCAGQFAESTHAPPRVDVPEPGAAAGTRAPAPAAPQPGVAKAYPARPAAAPATTAPRPAYPAAQPPRAGQPPSPYPAAPGGIPAAEPAPEAALPLPGAAPSASGDGFTIEPGDDRAAAQVELHAPPPSANTAVNTLLAQAATERRGGNLDAAIAAAERALRIAPADPAVYCELATLRLERGDYALAEQLARKGLSYQPDAEMQQRLGAIIERARRGKSG